MKKRALLVALLIVPMGIVQAQESGEKRTIMHALIEARATAMKMRDAVGTVKNESRATYQKVANELIKAIEALRTNVEEISDPIALQEAEVKALAAAEAIKVLLIAIRAGDIARASEKSKSAARALDEAAELLHIAPAETAAEEIQEAVQQEGNSSSDWLS